MKRSLAFEFRSPLAPVNEFAKSKLIVYYECRRIVLNLARMPLGAELGHFGLIFGISGFL